MKIVLDEGAIMPSRAHPYDAGLDLYTPHEAYVSACYTDNLGHVTIGNCTIDTGVHVQIPEGYVGLIKSKSGLNVKSGLTGEGVIDARYTGSIMVKLYNHLPICHSFQRGDKIAQLVIVPCLLPELELADSLEDTERGANGFGSTGR